MDWPIRYRAWIVMGVALVAVVVVGVLSGHGKGQKGAAIDRPRVSFGFQVRQPGGGSDLGGLVYTNAWTVSSGAQTIGVYAGGQRSSRRNGLFVILRRSGHRQQRARIVVHGSGSLTLLRPAIPATEDAALVETLHFITASGGSGTLDLSSDSVKLSR